MGQRGTKPTPTKILEMRGSWRAKAREGEPRPEPSGDQAKAPGWMDRKSQTLFRKKVAQMAEVGTMTAHDVEALARYCRLYTRYRAAEEDIMAHGSTINTYVMDKQGQPFLTSVKIRPEAQLANTLAAELLRLENHFGFTPSARTGLRVDKKAQHADTDQKTRLFRQKA